MVHGLFREYVEVLWSNIWEFQVKIPCLFVKTASKTKNKIDIFTAMKQGDEQICLCNKLEYGQLYK